MTVLRRLSAMLALVMALAIVQPAGASQADVRASYTHAYYTVKHHVSAHAAGRNIRRLGVAPGKPATTSDYQREIHRLRKVIANTQSWSTVTASWYDDGGSTASGYHSYYGVATCGSQVPVCYPFGTKITFRYGGNTVTTIVDDHGPYANGAGFDLNKHVRDALGFDGVHPVDYSVVH